MIDKLKFYNYNNIGKFNYLESIFETGLNLSIEDYKIILESDYNVRMHFFCEYSFLDIEELDKFELIKNYLNININTCPDEYDFSDLLDLSRKIKYSDILWKIDFNILNQGAITAALNFIEDIFDLVNLLKLKSLLLDLSKYKLNQHNKFITLYNLGKLDNKYIYKARQILKKHNKLISTRISNNANYYYLI